MDPNSNPYQSPTTYSEGISIARPLSVRRNILRNFLSCSLCLVGFCVIDYFYVQHGPDTVSWAEFLFLPVFFGSIVFANRALFTTNPDRVSRWFAILGTSLLVALLSGCVLITLGIWFHFAIGGIL